MYIYTRQYKAEYKDARQYNANRHNLLVTPGAASVEPLKRCFICLGLARFAPKLYTTTRSTIRHRRKICNLEGFSFI